MQTPRAKTVCYSLISIGLTAVLLHAVFSGVDAREFGSYITGASPRLVLIYVALSLTGLFLRAWRYLLVFTEVHVESERLTPFRVLVLTGIRSAFVDALPARLGELSFFYVLHRYGVRMATAVAAFGFCLALDILVLLLLAGTAAAFSYGLLEQVKASDGVLLIAASIALFFLLLPRLHRAFALAARICALCGNHRWIERARAFCVRAESDLQALGERRLLLQFGLLTLGLRFSKYCSLYILLLAVLAPFGFGFGSVSPYQSTIAFILAETSASLPVSGLLGFGAYEAVWSLVFDSSNIGNVSIIRVIFAVHIITQVVGYAVGVVSLVCFFGSLRTESS